MTRSIFAILFCTLVSTWHYITLSLATCTECPERMTNIVEGHEVAPHAYRLLAPHIIAALGNTPQAFALYHLVMFAMFFSLLWLWARRWQIEPLVVVPLAALAISVMMPTWYFSVWAVMEWNLWLCGLLLLHYSSSAR